MTVNRRLGRWVAGLSVVVLLAACRGRPSRPAMRDRLLARQFRRQHQRLPAASGGALGRVAVPRTGGWRAPRGSAPGVAGGAGSGHPTVGVRRHPWRLDGRCHHERVVGRGDRNRRGQRPTGPGGDGRYRIHHQDGDRGRDHVPGTGRSDRPGHPGHDLPRPPPVAPESHCAATALPHQRRSGTHHRIVFRRGARRSCTNMDPPGGPGLCHRTDVQPRPPGDGLLQFQLSIARFAHRAGSPG